MSLAGNLYSTEDTNFKYLYDAEPVCNRKNVVSYRSVVGRFLCGIHISGNSVTKDKSYFFFL